MQLIFPLVAGPEQIRVSIEQENVLLVFEMDYRWDKKKQIQHEKK